MAVARGRRANPATDRVTARGVVRERSAKVSPKHDLGGERSAGQAKTRRRETENANFLQLKRRSVPAVAHPPRKYARIGRREDSAFCRRPSGCSGEGGSRDVDRLAAKPGRFYPRRRELGRRAQCSTALEQVTLSRDTRFVAAGLPWSGRVCPRRRGREGLAMTASQRSSRSSTSSASHRRVSSSGLDQRPRGGRRRRRPAGELASPLRDAEVGKGPCPLRRSLHSASIP